MLSKNSDPSQIASKEPRQIRRRTTFTRYVKKRILELFKLYKTSESNTSIRSIATKIYYQLGIEALVR